MTASINTSNTVTFYGHKIIIKYIQSDLGLYKRSLTVIFKELVKKFFKHILLDKFLVCIKVYNTAINQWRTA